MPAYATDVLADDPWGYWRLQETSGSSFADAASHSAGAMTLTGTVSGYALTGPDSVNADTGILFAGPDIPSAKTNWPSEIPAYALDGTSNPWTTDGSANPTWWQVQLALAQVCTGYAITRRDDIPGRNVRDFTFLGSNDGTTWTTLDTQTGITWPTVGQIQSFSFANVTAYNFYRVNITANNGDTYTSIREITFTGFTPVLAGVAGHLTSASQPSPNISACTFEAWVKLTALPSVKTGLVGMAVSFGSGTSDKTLTLNTDGTLEWYVYDGAVHYQTTGFPLTLNIWHHIVGTVGASGQILYQDGVAQLTTPTVVSSYTGAAQSVFIRGANSTNSGTAGMQVSEVAVYTSQLSAARIAAHFSDTGNILPPASRRLVEAYVEALTIPAATHRNLMESYVEALTVPSATRRNLVESYVEALTVPLATRRSLMEAYVEALVPSLAIRNLMKDSRITALAGTVLWLRAKDNVITSVPIWFDQSGAGHNGFSSGSILGVYGYSTPIGGPSVRFSGSGMFRCSVVGGAIATASTAAGGEPPTSAIDGNLVTYFTTNGVKTGWLQLQLPFARVVTSYSIRRRDDLPMRNISAWTFEGSNDGSTWTTLETRSGVTWPTAGQTQAFAFSNSTAYLCYRVNFSDNNGDPSYSSIAEIAVDHYMQAVTAAEIWAVIKSDGNGSGPWSFNDRSDARAFSYYPYNGSNGIYEAFGVKNDSGGIIATYPGNTGWHIYRVVMDGINVTAYIDGVSIGTHTVAAAGGVNWGMSPLVGQTAAGNNLDAFFHGNMAEVLVRTVVSTPLEVGDITNYLRAEHFADLPPFQGWGIPL